MNTKDYEKIIAIILFGLTIFSRSDYKNENNNNPNEIKKITSWERQLNYGNNTKQVYYEKSND